MITPPSGGTGTVRVPMRSGVRRANESSTPVPVPPSLVEHRVLADPLRGPYLQMIARPGAVPCARQYARQLLREWGLQEFTGSVAVVVSELVTNAVRASGGLDPHRPVSEAEPAAARLWLRVEERGVLIEVWDASPSSPERQAPGPEAESGRGLLLVEMLSAAWGAFELAHEPGKVVWALCQS